ncbi:hypothetical protein V8E52_002943 [Russula decolorans]
MACNRCKGTSSDPFNFLLSCSECGKNWHHRCHIPPLADPELIALIRATNENDVDNGLSSWIGRCCKRKRVRAEAMPEFKCPKASVDSAPSAPLVDIRQPRSLSVSAEPEIVVHGGSPQKAASLHGPDSKQTTPGGVTGVAASPKPGDDGVDGDLGFNKPVGSGGSQRTSVQPAVQHVGVRGSTGLIPPDGVPSQSTRPPALSAGSAPPSFHNQPTSFQPTSFSQYARPPHLRESSMTLERKSESSGRLAEATHVQALSQSSKRPTSVGGAGNASTKSTSRDIDPPTLDLRALSLNRATQASKAPSRLFFHRTTESRPPSPPPPTPLPPVKSEDSEMEDLYGPTREPQRRRSLSPQLPSESEPRVLPALAAKDPHVLAVLERQELREAARPRQGRRKSQPVKGAGKRRAGFVLVEGLTAGRADQKSR